MAVRMAQQAGVLLRGALASTRVVPPARELARPMDRERNESTSMNDAPGTYARRQTRGYLEACRAIVREHFVAVAARHVAADARAISEAP
jgi:hypothetical protein